MGENRSALEEPKPEPGAGRKAIRDATIIQQSPWGHWCGEAQRYEPCHVRQHTPRALDAIEAKLGLTRRPSRGLIAVVLSSASGSGSANSEKRPRPSARVAMLTRRLIGSWSNINASERCSHLLEQLRQARKNAFRDAEGFDQIIHVVERLGSSWTLIRKCTFTRGSIAAMSMP